MATKEPIQLAAADLLAIDDATVFIVQGADGSVVKLTLAELRAKFGDITFSGDATGTGPFGTIALTIANGAVTLAKMAPLASSRLIGRSTAGTGTPEAISIGAGLSLTAGVLDVAASQNASDVSPLLDYFAFGGL